jgi:hypothetical protein
MNPIKRQAIFNILFAIFVYAIRNRLINTDHIVLLLDHISNHFYEEMYHLFFR